MYKIININWSKAHKSPLFGSRHFSGHFDIFVVRIKLQHYRLIYMFTIHFYITRFRNVFFFLARMGCCPNTQNIPISRHWLTLLLNTVFRKYLKNWMAALTLTFTVVLLSHCLAAINKENCSKRKLSIDTKYEKLLLRTN